MNFLTAEWRKLVMLNYLVEPELLYPYVPYGTELDYWNGKLHVSLVGFMFLNTKVLGLPIPFHRNFEEMNLRFYVRCKQDGEWRRGVVFIKEIVPKFMISFVARSPRVRLCPEWLRLEGPTPRLGRGVRANVAGGLPRRHCEFTENAPQV